jgi:hypothetical protein
MNKLILFFALSLALTISSGNTLKNTEPNKSGCNISLPIRIVNQSTYDADVFIEGFHIGTFKPTEEANLTMAFTNLKIVLADSSNTTFTIKPQDIPEKCVLIVIRDKKTDFCPADFKE